MSRSVEKLNIAITSIPVAGSASSVTMFVSFFSAALLGRRRRHDFLFQIQLTFLDNAERRTVAPIKEDQPIRNQWSSPASSIQ